MVASKVGLGRAAKVRVNALVRCTEPPRCATEVKCGVDFVEIFRLAALAVAGKLNLLS